MKRRVLLRIAAYLSLMICMLTGCTETVQQGTADDEVLTLKAIPADKLMLTMRVEDGANFERMESAIENQFSEIDIVLRRNTSVSQSIQYRDTDDIVLMAKGDYRVSDLAVNFIDLAAEPYLQNYYLSTLMESEFGGKLYYLPGPSNIYGIVYNKDMFRKYGWNVPENLDEFIELCLEIETTGIRAIQPALYYKDAVRQFFTGFTYKEIFSGGENEKWLFDYRNGNAVMEGHMEPAFDIMDRLIEAGVLRTEDFDVQPRMRSESMYKQQTCAMIFETQLAEEYAANSMGEEAPALGLLPFFSGSDDDSDYFLFVPIYHIAISKRLEDKGNEEKLAAAKEILAYLSTAQGQAAIGADTSVISSVKGVEYAYNEFLSGGKDTIEKGHVVPQPFFIGNINTEVDHVLREDLRRYTEGEIDRTQFMLDLDRARDQVLNKQETVETRVIGTAEETFSILQTACLLGEIFQERTDAQIGICAANTRELGNNWKIYKGEILYGRNDTFDNYLDSAFPHGKDNKGVEGKLIKVRMTGENILNALNTPYLRSSSFPDAYLIPSGLQITFAPWAEEGKRYVNVTMADGKALNPDEVYTVAFWNGVVNPALIESVEKEYDDGAADLFEAWVRTRGGRIEPDNHDFILDWTTR